MADLFASFREYISGLITIQVVYILKNRHKDILELLEDIIACHFIELTMEFLFLFQIEIKAITTLFFRASYDFFQLPKLFGSFTSKDKIGHTHFQHQS